MNKARIAILSDIHGNSIALEAVLGDIKAQGGADGYWILGDLVAIGPDPLGVLERLAGLPNAHIIRGNTDYLVTSGERPTLSQEKIAQQPEMLPRWLEFHNSFAWTLGAVAASGWLEWLSSLALEKRFVLPDGTRVLCVHASPGTDSGSGFHPMLGDEEKIALAKGCEADLILVGHTHVYLDLYVGNTRVVNPSSISNPFPPDLMASYLWLQAEASGYHLIRREVDYDRQAVIQAARQVKHPATAMISQHMNGIREPGWKRY